MKSSVLILVVCFSSIAASIEINSPNHVVEIKQKIHFPGSENKSHELSPASILAAPASTTVSPVAPSVIPLPDVIPIPGQVSNKTDSEKARETESILSRMFHKVMKRSLSEDEENIEEMSDEEMAKNSKTDAAKSLEKRILSLEAQKSLFERLYLEQLNLIKSFCKQK